MQSLNIITGRFKDFPPISKLNKKMLNIPNGCVDIIRNIVNLKRNRLQ